MHSSPGAGGPYSRRRARGEHAGPPRAAFQRLVATESRLAVRNPAAIIWAIGFPIALLIVFGALPSMNSPQASLEGFTALQVYLPVMIGFCLSMLALIVLPVPLVTYRELGVLRRMATTPVPPTWLLGAQIVLNLCLFAAAVLIIVAGVAIVFGANLTIQPPGFAVSLVLAVAPMVALGLCVASVARTQRAASGIGGALFFFMAFCAGVWLPRQAMPAWLRTVSGIAPMGAGVHALDTSMLGPLPTGPAAARDGGLDGGVRRPRDRAVQVGVAPPVDRSWNVAILTASEPGRRNRRTVDSVFLALAAVLLGLSAAIASSAPRQDHDVAHALAAVFGWAEGFWCAAS